MHSVERFLRVLPTGSPTTSSRCVLLPLPPSPLSFSVLTRPTQIALDRLPEWCVAEIARELSPCINVVGTNVGGSVVLQKLVLLLKDDGDAGYRREFLSGIAKATSILIFDKYGSVSSIRLSLLREFA